MCTGSNKSSPASSCVAHFKMEGEREGEILCVREERECVCSHMHIARNNWVATFILWLGRACAEASPRHHRVLLLLLLPTPYRRANAHTISRTTLCTHIQPLAHTRRSREGEPRQHRQNYCIKCFRSKRGIDERREGHCGGGAVGDEARTGADFHTANLM